MQVFLVCMHIYIYIYIYIYIFGAFESVLYLRMNSLVETKKNTWNKLSYFGETIVVRKNVVVTNMETKRISGFSVHWILPNTFLTSFTAILFFSLSLSLSLSLYLCISLSLSLSRFHLLYIYIYI